MIVTGLSLGTSLADQIKLVGDESLSGRILSISDDGILALQSSITSAPIRLKSSAVEKVVFSDPQEVVKLAPAMVELINGDLLPATLLRMEENVLTVQTEIAGEISIPRKMLKSLQLGIRSSEVFYSGPSSSEEWSQGTEAEVNWKFENMELISHGQAHAVGKVKLPTNFSLDFTFSWQGNPNLKVYLADPLGPREKPSNRYLFQFGANGLELKRESSVGNRFTTLILSDRTPEFFLDKTIDIQIRIDRTNSRLQLWVDGEQEAAGVDPVNILPEGSAISFINQDRNGSLGEASLKNIRVTDFDDTQKRQLAEERGPLEMDSLISRDDDRWGGRLLGIRNTAEGLVFSFNSDFQPQPLELLESDVSTLFFAVETEITPEVQANPYVLRLHGGGRLQILSCSFTEASVLAVHPLLGKLVMTRSNIAALECVKAEPLMESEE